MTPVEFANRAIGVPFLDGGRGWSGWDCWGLVCVAYREVFGIDLPLYGDVSVSDTRAVRRAMAADAATHDTWKQVQVPQDFDVIGMRSADGGRLCHVGLFLGHKQVLHVERASYTVKEPTTGPIIRGRIVGYWRHASA